LLQPGYITFAFPKRKSNSPMNSIPLSVLDLAVVTEGGNATLAIERTVQLARHVEQEGYNRLWLAEHHNMANIASSATAVLIGHVAGHTSTIRVGSGGIMLPNHSPLAVAEQFGTLETLYPGRIDLGLGRAPGTDQATAMALRRNFADGSYNFGRNIEELQHYFSNTSEQTRVRAFPGEGADIPIWVLGSSTDSAYLAAEMGLPYAFAAHFAPAQFRAAIKIYRQHFKPSAQLTQPYVMACVNMIAGANDEEAQYLATSVYQMFLGIITNKRRPLQPPVKSMDALWDLQERAAVAQMTSCTFIGGKETLREKLHAFIEETEINELMMTSNIYDMEARLRSFSILKEALHTA
jgi:luciferase family oxidoreductase group 1